IRAPAGTVCSRSLIWKASVPAAAAWMAWRVPQRQLPGTDQVRGTHSDTRIDYTHDLSRRCLRVESEASRTKATHACQRLDRTAQGTTIERTLPFAGHGADVGTCRV